MSTEKKKILWLVCVLQILFGATTRCEEETSDTQWWRNTLIYQIWPRAFQDSDGDGEGDLRGIISRLDYIKELAVDTILISPIYASPLIDGGFDVANYTLVNPTFGNFEDFDSLIEKAHELELKVILDMIPNHSSNQCRWFQLSTEKVEPYTNYYIWSGAKKANGSVDAMPNNWVSVYDTDKAGSAWTWNDAREEWYYHKFHTTQPDLNLRNPDVVRAILDVFDFWLERNVDGFRINSVSYFFEDEQLRNEAPTGSGIYTRGLAESTEFLYKIRSHVDDWVKRNNATSKLLIAESDDSDKNLITYYGNATHRGIAPINVHLMRPINNNTNASYIKSVIDEWMNALPENAITNWMLSNHDYSRVPSRIGLNRVDGLHMFELLLPGQAFTYYGEEIAMFDGKITWEKTIDPIACSRSKETYETFSRDPARTPMQWNDGVSAGFSTNNITYLPVNPDYKLRNVESQLNKSKSNLMIYRTLAQLRKQKVFTDGDYELVASKDNRVLILKRSIADQPVVYIVLANLDLRQAQVNLTEFYPDLNDTLDIVVMSSNAVLRPGAIGADSIKLTANAAVVLRGEIIKEKETTIVTSTTITTASNATTVTDAVTDNSTVTSDNTATDTDSTITVTIANTTLTDASTFPSTISTSTDESTNANTDASTDTTESTTAETGKITEDDGNSATNGKSIVTLVLITTVFSVLFSQR